MRSAVLGDPMATLAFAVSLCFNGIFHSFVFSVRSPVRSAPFGAIMLTFVLSNVTWHPLSHSWPIDHPCGVKLSFTHLR